eukprot:c11113_g1_i1.p1 GENE.c11113_g1_i1~~c11113_g1_i1.p1  ORF type:complete len:821 (-),score=243.84 c11113_g1_i1:104-2533(-)
MANEQNKKKYVLSWENHHHTADVRCVTAWGDHIVTGSRDKTAVLWKPQQTATGGVEYAVALTLVGHGGFINAITSFGALDQGFVVTGSQDTTARLWSSAGNELGVLVGHEDSVCALAVSPDGLRLVSGSWDKTARVWDLQSHTCVAVLSGHQASVWSTCFVSSTHIATVSADKNLRVFSATGECVRTNVAHADACRSVIAIPAPGAEGSGRVALVTSGNDGLVKLWDLDTGVMLQAIDEHEGLPVYHVTSGGGMLLTCSEDKNLKILSNTHNSRSTAYELQQSLPHPCVLWASCVLPSGDIASAGADGWVRVWTNDLTRAAPDEVLQRYDLSLASQSVSTQMVGQIDKTKIQGVEALLEDGIRPDQRKIVNNNGNVEIYQWITSDQRWTKIGDVVDTEKADPKTIGGVKYDYVFDVDIKEGEAPLKLGFNRGDDAWATAQQFLWKNNLEQEYLQQVADFIVRNVGADAVGSMGGLRGDPLTGGSRYIPRAAGARPNVPPPSSSGTPSQPVTVPSAFLGGGAYTSSSAKAAPTPMGSTYFPSRTMTTFASGNFGAMEKKILEFNAQQTPELSLSEDEVNALRELVGQLSNAASSVVLTAQHVTLVRKLTSWPVTHALPALDLARLAVLASNGHVLFSSQNLAEDQLWQQVFAFSSHEQAAPLRMLALRFFCNMFAQNQTRTFIVQNLGSVLTHVSGTHRVDHANTRAAFIALLHNVSVQSLSKVPGSVIELDMRLGAIQQLTNCLHTDNDTTNLLNALVSLATLAYSDPMVREALAAEMSIASKLRSLSENGPTPEVRRCALDFKQYIMG